MKSRPSEDKARIARELSAIKKAHASPTPASHAPEPTTTKQPAPCPNCARLEISRAQDIAEIAQLKKMVATLLARIDDLDAKVKSKGSTQPKDGAEDKDTLDALHRRVIAEKVSRINNYGKGHSIGSARI